MTQRRLTLFSIFLLLAFTAPYLAGAIKSRHLAANGLGLETKKAASGYTYTIFYKNNLQLDASLKRPDKNDPNIVLCIPGAFTNLADYTVDGLYIDNGKIINEHSINHSLGGAICITGSDCTIFPTQKGRLLTDSLIRRVATRKGSLFQQIQMIENGVGATYKDNKLFQRRAIVKLKGGKTAIIESYEHITLAAFTKDLTALGAVDALYTDMGAWDEGWYKDPAGNAPVTIGRMKTQTDKQSNWVVYKVK